MHRMDREGDTLALTARVSAPTDDAPALICPECGSSDLAIEQLMFAPAYPALDEEGLWQVRFDHAALSPGETDREPVLCGECGACHEELDVLDASGLLEGEDDLAQMGGEV